MRRENTSDRVRHGFFPGTKGHRLYGRDHDAKKDRWSILIPVRAGAMALAGEKLLVAGPPDVVPEEDPLAAFEGRLGAKLWAFLAEIGKKRAELAELEFAAGVRWFDCCGRQSVCELGRWASALL